MENANLPIPSAREPDEEARQPQLQVYDTFVTDMPPPKMDPHEGKKTKSVAGSTTQSSEISASQSSSNGDECQPLSLPPPDIPHRQRLQWLQERRSTGLWAECDECGQWRRLPHVLDRHELPREWYCRMNPDASAAICSVPEVPIRVRDEEDMIHSEYSAGSIVLARITGYPWWPAMVDDCPDVERYYWLDGYSDIPTYFNVVFFDSNDMDVTRAWIPRDKLKPYGLNKKEFKRLLNDSIYRNRLMAAAKQADDAESLTLRKRLTKYSFVSRYRGQIHKPEKVDKNVLKKFQNKLKRKMNIVFESDSSEDSDREETASIRKSNVIHTPKRTKQIKKRIITKETKDQVHDSNELKSNKVIQTGTPKKFISKEAKNFVLDSDQSFKHINRNDGDLNISTEGFKTQNVSATKLSKEPYSLSVQISTSRTFVPESESEPESVHAIEKEINKFHRRASRDSADFDFN